MAFGTVHFLFPAAPGSAHQHPALRAAEVFKRGISAKPGYTSSSALDFIFFALMFSLCSFSAHTFLQCPLAPVCTGNSSSSYSLPSFRATTTRSHFSRASSLANSNPSPLEAPVIRATFLFLMVLTPPQAAQAVLIRLMPANRTFRPIIVPMAKAVMEGFIMLRMPRTISRMPLSMTTHQRLAMTFMSKVLWN